jgi:hypothetical protein
MGNKQSISQDFNLKAVNKAVYNQVTKNSAKGEAAGFNTQSLNIDVGINDGCPIKTNQKISSKVVSSTKNMPKTIVDMKGEIANDMKQAAGAKLKSMTGALSTNFGSKSTVKQKINQTIENVVNKTITTENMTESIAKSVNIQDGNLKVKFMRCRDGKGGIDMTQDITSELAANAVTDALTKSLMQDKFVNKIAQEQKAESVVENTGPIQDLGNAISGIFGSLTAIYAICGLVVCLAIAAGAYILLSPAGQNAMSAAASKI